MKRLYLLLSIAALQVLLGSLLMLQAAQPIRMSQPVLAPAGSYYLFEFGILGTGRLTGNLSEINGRSFDLFVFDDRGFASFRDGSNAVPALFSQQGARFEFDMTLPGSGEFYIVAVDLPARQGLQINLVLAVFGLKPIETIVALIVLAGGLALVGASLTLNVWSWRRGPPASSPSSDPAPDPLTDGLPEVRDSAKDPPDDKTRIY